MREFELLGILVFVATVIGPVLLSIVADLTKTQNIGRKDKRP